MEYDSSRGKNLSMVILDNARIHRAQDVRKFAKEHKDRLMIIFQPKYSPELNPQENMWNWMKQFMQQASAYKNAQELIIKLEEFAEKVNNNADEVKNMVYTRKFYK
jgi:transposase